MKTIKIIKKVFAVGFIGLIGLSTLTGCMGPSEAEIQQQIDSAVEEAVSNVDITQDNAQVISEAVEPVQEEVERLQQVIEDMEKAEKEIEQEDLEESSTETELQQYIIDNVALNGTFEESVDSDDFEGLYYEDVEYDGESYVAEETLLLSSSVAPVLNIKGFNGDIAVEISDKGGILYKVDFDEEIVLDSENEDDVLEVSFLGEPLKVIEYDKATQIIKYRMAEQFTQEVGSSFEFSDKNVEIVSINEDGDKIFIKVGDVSDTIEEGKTKKINDVEIYVEDVFSGKEYRAVKLYVGNDVVQTAQDGDEFENDERYEWVIEGEDGLKSLGVILDERYDDDDEVLKIEDSISLPNEYLSISFEKVENIETKQLSMDISKTDIEVEYEGFIEIDGNKIDNSELTILDDLTYDYKYKDEKYESNDNFSKIVIINEDRELSLNINSTSVKVYDDDVTYEFEYQFGDNSEFLSAIGDAENMNDDDNYRLVNGDLLMVSDVNEDDEEEDMVSIGLVSDEEVEALLSINK